MRHTTAIGLDIHARSISAAALNVYTGEIVQKKFVYDPEEIAEWIKRFDNPEACYESGVTGFDLAKKLKKRGIECMVVASSKLQRPPADAKRKNDANDAVFLARLLSVGNVSPVAVPDDECEAARDLVRALDDCRKDLMAARHRLTKFLMRHGYTFNEKNDKGQTKSSWTKDHWAWIRAIEFKEPADQDTLDYYISEVFHFQNHKKALERRVYHYAGLKRWKSRVDALRYLKGIETLTAFTLVVEAQVFSRFGTADEFAAWTGLVPSEHSSGQKRVQGSITKTGNGFVRRLLVEASWTYARATGARKPRPSDDVPLSIENHAAKATKRLVRRRRHLQKKGKKPAVANIATARELACFVWAIGCAVEGTYQL